MLDLYIYSHDILETNFKLDQLKNQIRNQTFHI